MKLQRKTSFSCGRGEHTLGHQLGGFLTNLPCCFLAGERKSWETVAVVPTGSLKVFLFFFPIILRLLVSHCLEGGACLCKQTDITNKAERVCECMHVCLYVRPCEFIVCGGCWCRPTVAGAVYLMWDWSEAKNIKSGFCENAWFPRTAASC